MNLSSALERTKRDFLVTNQYLDNLVNFFEKEAREGLQKDSERSLPMLPSFVTQIPNGSEKGLFLAADLGGSNFRVCSVHLNGDRSHELKQMKWRVPNETMKGSAAKFWTYLAKCIQDFLTEHHPEQSSFELDGNSYLKMGFTFSFPIRQTALNSGTLIRWTKGYAIEDAVGTDVCESLQTAVRALNLPVDVVAIVNDTVGCLLARSYETGSSAQTLVGCILGTGTNAAYSEKISRIPKLATYDSVPKSAKVMVVNTEWGSFDNNVKFLPNTEYDQALDLMTPNPRFHMFEKRVSGMFLGEILRRVLESFLKKGTIFTSAKTSLRKDADILTPWSIDTSFLSYSAADGSSDLTGIQQELTKIGISDSSLEERQAVKEICHVVALRSARLVAGIIAGLLKMTKAFEKFEVVDIGMDGAIIEFYPHYEEMVREALRSLRFVGANEKRITIGISRDGSGIGAALCAAMAG